MGIKHAFTSAKSDGGDATLVKPSDWNADHTLVIENYSNYLGADVTLTSANTFFDGTSLSLTAGGWELDWCQHMIVLVGTSQTYEFTGRLWDGTTIYGEDYTSWPISGNYQTWATSLKGHTIVTLTTTTTLKISVAVTRASSSAKIARDVATNSASSHRASYITASRISD